MNSPTPEEIKRHAISFRDYWLKYNNLRNEYLIASSERSQPTIIDYKSDDKLYEEFTEGKPVSL